MSTPLSAEPAAPVAGPLARAFAAAVVALRWWILAFWALATLLSLLVLPALSESKGGSSLRGLLPDNTPAIRNELRSVELFGFPLLGRTILVQRNADGLSVYDQARTVTHAVGVNTGRYDGLGPLLGVLPITNTLGLFPSSSERNTTALSYMFMRPDASFSAQSRGARNYAETCFGDRDDVVGVTGSAPARAQQGRIIKDKLPLVEAATLGAIVLIVGINFRSLVAPVVTIITTGVAYAMTLRLTGYLTDLFDVASPSELQPVVVALLLGVVTDYVVFYCSALRHQLSLGADRLDAARIATAQFAPIIAVAGLAVAAGTAALVVAESAFFRALGPALVFTVLISLVVAITLVPALMAVLGRVLFWPTHPAPDAPDARLAPEPHSDTAARLSPIAWIVANRRNAGITVAASVAVLSLAALPLARLDLGVSFVGSLPGSTSVAQSAAAAESGFSPGILSPTELLIEGSALDEQRRQLAEFAERVESFDGVSGVLGPGNQPAGLERGILLSDDGNAARILVVLEDRPLDAAAVHTIDRLETELPSMLGSSGLSGATVGLVGDTATALFIVDQTKQDLLRIALAAVAANLLMLTIFLRALVAPLFLLGATFLSVGAALGLTTWLFDGLDPGAGLTFYVPFAAAVLLLAFGSDYNIFGVGHVWDEARHRPLTEAITVAMPQTTRAITAAGVALAASFGLLAVVPLEPFRQLAFAMSVGILIDVLVVRSLLMPALLTVVGPASAWPSRRLAMRA